MQPRDKLDRVYKTLMIIALVITGVILLKDIVIPVAFAALLSVVLLPLARKLERTTGRIFSILITLLGSFVIMGLIIWFVIAQVTSLVASLPGLEQKFYTVVTQASEALKQTINISTVDQSKFISDGIKEMSSSLAGLLISTSYLAYFVIQVPIYIFLFLLYREKFKVFILNFTVGDELLWQKDVEGVIQGYIRGLAIVILITGTMISIGLLLLGIQHAVFFGFLSGTLVMIPYIGIGMGATLPFLVALVTKDSIWYAVGVIAVHGFVQFLEGNFITPRITGSRISVNAIAAIIALLVGEKLLGIPGMILAIPAVGTLRILLSYSTTFKPFATLLEGSSAKSKDHPH